MTKGGEACAMAISIRTYFNLRDSRAILNYSFLNK